MREAKLGGASEGAEPNTNWSIQKIVLNESEVIQFSGTQTSVISVSVAPTPAWKQVARSFFNPRSPSGPGGGEVGAVTVTTAPPLQPKAQMVDPDFHARTSTSAKRHRRMRSRHLEPELPAEAGSGKGLAPPPLAL